MNLVHIILSHIYSLGPPNVHRVELHPKTDHLSSSDREHHEFTVIQSGLRPNIELKQSPPTIFHDIALFSTTSQPTAFVYSVANLSSRSLTAFNKILFRIHNSYQTRKCHPIPPYHHSKETARRLSSTSPSLVMAGVCLHAPPFLQWMGLTIVDIDGRFCSPFTPTVSCCIPCPVSDWLYPDNFNQVTRAAEWVNLVSMLCSVFLLASFIFLPVAYTHRHYLSVALTISIIVMQVSQLTFLLLSFIVCSRQFSFIQASCCG